MSKWLKNHFLMEISKTLLRSISLHIQVVFLLRELKLPTHCKKNKAKNWKKSNLFSFNFCQFLGFLLFRANSYSVYSRPEYRFSLTHILPCKHRSWDSVLIEENADQRKPGNTYRKVFARIYLIFWKKMFQKVKAILWSFIGYLAVLIEKFQGRNCDGVLI